MAKELFSGAVIWCNAGMPVLILLVLLASPLSAELLEAEIRFQGTGCVSCAESLEPRLARIRGMETVELDLEEGRIRLKLEAGNRARIGPLRLRVTQDGTKILSMSAVAQGVAARKDRVWTFTLSGPNEEMRLQTADGIDLEPGRPYRLSGAIEETEDGELAFQAESAKAIPQPEAPAL